MQGVVDTSRFLPLGSEEKKNPKGCTRGIHSQKSEQNPKDQLLWQGSEGYLYEMESIEDKCQQQLITGYNLSLEWSDHKLLNRGCML